MRMLIELADGSAVGALLEDRAIARDFSRLLPLGATLEDYASTEKIIYLPRRLDTTGAEAGCAPSSGDITYYAPWGNIAIFYRDFGYASGLIKLGVIESGLDALKGPHNIDATLNLAK